MNKKHIYLRCLVGLLLLMSMTLWGCADQAPAQTTPPTENTTVNYLVDIGGSTVDMRSEELDLTGMSYSLETLLAASGELSQLTVLNLGPEPVTPEQLDRLQEAFPHTEIRYHVSLFGKAVASDTAYLDLADMTAAQTQELIEILPCLPLLEEINFVNSEGGCVYAMEDIGELDKLKAAAPEVFLHVSFDLFGQTVTSKDTRIEYVDAQIGEEGLELFYQVLPHLTGCEYLLLDECGISNERMDQFRDDFPQVKIVWRIWLGAEYTVLTDVEKILASSGREPRLHKQDTEPLKYCRDVIYMDLGHNRIEDISFVTYMPKLEVLILAVNYVYDATPLASCTNLEYLEIFTTLIYDISPLSSLTNLKHLNLCNIPIRDASPLYGLTNLERLWVGCTTKLSRASIAELREKLPNCEINSSTASPSAEGWRIHPRYDLLREQFGYDELDYCFWWRDEKFK